MNYKFNPNIQARKKLRLENYDYSSKGLYFITISVKDKLCLFGDIKNNELNLNDSGNMVIYYWLELEKKFKNIKLHDFIVMPNHFHGIIEIVEQNKKCNCSSCRDTPCGCPEKDIFALFDKNSGGTHDKNTGGTHRFTPTGGIYIYNNESISSVIKWFKTMTTNEYIKNVKQNSWLVFNKQLWQRSFYDNIIRNEESYLKISEYIINNPIKWKEDKFYYSEI